MICVELIVVKATGFIVQYYCVFYVEFICITAIEVIVKLYYVVCVEFIVVKITVDIV